MSRRFFTIAAAASLAMVLGLLARSLFQHDDESALRFPSPEERRLEGDLEQSSSLSEKSSDSSHNETTRVGARICGVAIREAGGAPAPRALIALRGPTGATTTKVDDNGGFCFGDLQAGSYEVAASEGRLRSETVEGLILYEGEEVRDLALVLRGGTWVSGSVLDRRTGIGIEGAQVLAYCSAGMGLSTATSARDGAFVLDGLPAGMHRLNVRASGYSSGDMLLEVAGLRPLKGVTLILDPVARVAGRVEDEAGVAVAGAHVVAVAYRLHEQYEPVGVRGADGAVLSEIDGTFEVEAPSGLVTIFAAADGRSPGRTDGVEVSPGALSEGIVVRLGPGAGLRVEVVDSVGDPAPGASVRVICDGRVLCGQAATGAQGRVVFEDLGPGRVWLEALGAGGTGSAGIWVEVSAGVRRVLTVALSDDGFVTGVVVDGRDRPVPGAIVRAGQSPEDVLGSTATNPQGRFHLAVSADLSFSVRAESGDATGERRGVRSGDEIRLVIQEPGSVSGYVADESGRPVTDFTVTVVTAGDGESPPIWRRQRFASERGDFSISGLLPGAYRLQASGPGYAAGEEVAARVWARDDVGPIALRVSSAGRVRGRVLDPNGRPVPGARVAVEPARLHGLARWSGSAGSAVESDSSGAFLLEDVPSGPARRVFAWHPDWMASAGGPVSVDPGVVSGPVEVKLRPRRGGPARSPQAFGGVGMTIASDGQGQVRVGEVFPGGPAFLAGLRTGDHIVSIDGVRVEGSDLGFTLSLIRGPVGTEVTLTIERGAGVRVDARMVRVELRL